MRQLVAEPDRRGDRARPGAVAGRRRGTGPALAGALVAGLLLAGCTGGGDGTGGARQAPPSPTVSRARADPTALVVQVRRVTGRLPGTQRAAVADTVGRVVDGWLEAAYLGEFPRTGTTTPFADFTPGAAARARRQRDLMSNAGLAARIDAARPVRRRAWLDVLAVGRRAVGVTARVELVFATTGQVTGSHRVLGTLALTPDGQGWRVFGFEVRREDGA